MKPTLTLDDTQDIIALGQAASLEQVRRDVIQECGIDPADPDVLFSDIRFNGKKFMHEAQTTLGMRETVAYSALSQVARYGVLKQMLDSYKRVNIVYKDIVTVVPSKTYSEFFAPIYETDIPRRVEPLEEADESRLIGLNVEIINREYARAIRVPRLLVKDDQTGQVLRRASNIGKGMGYAEEQGVFDAYVSHTFTNAGSGDINQLRIENGWIKLRQIKDPMGNLMVVLPDLLIVDVTRELTAEKLLESLFQPSVPFDPSNAVPSPATAGQPGYFQTKNVLEGKLRVVASPFISTQSLLQGGSVNGADGVSPKWYMTQAKEGLYFTDREPVAVTQEDPNSGKSWSTRSFAWQTTRRFGVGIVDDLFVYAGNG